MQSKSANNVCKLLQFLGELLMDFVPRPPTGVSPLDPNGELQSTQPSVL